MRMSKTALQMTPNEWKRYKPSIKTVNDAFNRPLVFHKTRKQAFQTANQAAKILRERFGARKVAVFGSLASNIGFSELSDIDLAVWGVPKDEYYKAVAVVTGLSTRFKIDLVDFESCRKSIKNAILEFGVEL